MKKSKKIRIGIPKALMYHKYYQLWKSFFKQLNCQLIISPDTNLEILNNGIKKSIDENCLPVKIFLGHINYLKNRCDYILIPRIASLYNKEESCGKLMSLYDISRNTFPNINFIHYNIDVENNISQKYAFLKIGLKFNKNIFKLLRFYKISLSLQLKKEKFKYLKQLKKLKEKNKLKILIVAHPYVIYDSFMGKPIIDFFKKEKNINLIFADVTKKNSARKHSKKISNDLYWSFNKELIGSINLYRKKIHGIIYLMAFPCGPDSLVIEMCQKKIKKIPSITITIDELQAESGLHTRLESFIDILNFKNLNK